MASWMDRASWIRLWESNIPPKLKLFVWQIFNRILPTMEALIEKDVSVLPRCPACWAHSKIMEHLFLDCLAPRAPWDHSRLECIGQRLPCHTFPLFLKKLMLLIYQPSLCMTVFEVL
ncbi:unnamed protein product [Linum trigynum]|uniref:Reverse transcriptase zinc-binding domain-containing protein n=1 Tax=Linum trigynum TaxID=586398 RepID=A0AAV2GTQ3_9ROSI